MKPKLYLLTLSLLILAHVCNAQEIFIEEGFWRDTYYLGDYEISNQEAKELLNQDPEFTRLNQKSKKHNLIAWAALAPGFGFAILQHHRVTNNKSQVIPATGAISSLVIAIGFKFSSARLKNKALQTYNTNQETQSLYRTPTPNGLGLVMSF